MIDIKEEVQKNIVNLCGYLEQHVENWKAVLQETESAIRALANQTEQLQNVDRTELLHVENFARMKDNIKFSIFNGIEEEITTIKAAIDKLSKTNNTLKSKLFTLEKSSLQLNWDENNILLSGNATQPPLSKILFLGLQFWQYFNNAYQLIASNFKSLDLKSEKTVSSLVKSFQVDLSENRVNGLIALTQYVNNPDFCK